MDPHFFAGYFIGMVRAFDSCGHRIIFPFFQGNFPAGKKVYLFASRQDKQIYPKHRVKALLFGENSGKIIQIKGFQIRLLKSILFVYLLLQFTKSKRNPPALPGGFLL